MSDFFEKLQTEYEHIARTRIGRLEPGLSGDEVISMCRQIVDDVRAHRVITSDLIETQLYPLLENIMDISDEEEAKLFDTVQKISGYETRLDTGLGFKIYQSLLERARGNKDVDKTIKYLYWCGITLYYLNRRNNKKILGYFKEGSSYSKQYRRLTNEESRKYINRCLANYHMMLFNISEPLKANELEDEILSFWNALIFSGINTDFPWLAYFLTCLTHKHAFLTKAVHTDPDSETKENMQRVLDSAITINKLFQRNRDLISVHGVSRYEFMLWEAQFLSGLISFDQLRKNIYDLQATFAVDDYSTDAIYVKINLFTFLTFFAANMRDLRGIKKDVLAESLDKVINYISSIPKAANTIEVTRQLRTLALDMGEILDPMEQLDFVLKLTSFRNITTYAHSIMVSKIAVCLTKFLIEENPEILVGCMDLATVSDVKKRAGELCEFAEACGLCHDIGKFIYADNPFMFARILTEDEFELVKRHPEEGSVIFSERGNALYSGYTDVMLGHHKHYNNLGGYPESFDIFKSRHRTMIDIIKVADTIDAATDDVGKAYATAKSLEEVCGDVIKGSGSEYSPVLSGLLKKDSVISTLKYILDNERKDAYYTAYTYAWS